MLCMRRSGLMIYRITNRPSPANFTFLQLADTIAAMGLHENRPRGLSTGTSSEHTLSVWATFTFLLFTILTHTHTYPFNGPFSGTTRVSRYQKGKTNVDFTEARDSEWQWHQLGHMQVCTSLQTDNHASTPPLRSSLQAGCTSCHPTNSVKALKAF